MNKPDQPSLFIHLRFAVIFFISLAIMAVDMRSRVLNDFRYYIESSLYPLMVFADAPRSVSKFVSSQFKSRSELIEENEKLSAENFLQRADILRIQSLEAENEALRRLLNSPSADATKRLVAEVIDVDSNPYLRRVVINRGSKSGVYEGMPVISGNGLVGQVYSLNYGFSRVLLISDPNCSVPVLCSRTNIRAITTGTGVHDELTVNNVPRSADIKVGDLLVTSGLGGVYPSGYPVAEVTSVGFSDAQPFANIKAKPIVDTDTMRYVLLYWYQGIDSEDTQNTIISKQRSDSKHILRQEKIKNLIESLSRTPEHQNKE
ncbi:MAG: rod shape-determining protein MreC [Succinatimonas sp.]|nr:rod shape-determining protein MreC [Succinatimonas sp.]